MGFGTLFIGYLFAFGFTSGTNYIMSLIGVFGTLFLYKASKQLSVYSKHFKTCIYVNTALFISYILNTLCQANIAFGVISLPGIICDVVRILLIISVFLYNLFMCLGIADIAKTAENKIVRVSAQRNIILLIFYYTLVVFGPVVLRLIPGIGNIIAIITSAVGVIWLVLNVTLTLSAYKRITIEGEEEQTLYIPQ